MIEAMGTATPPPADATPLAEVLPLTSARGAGEPYRRRADVEDCIARTIRVPVAQYDKELYKARHLIENLENKSFILVQPARKPCRQR